MKKRQKKLTKRYGKIAKSESWPKMGWGMAGTLREIRQLPEVKP